MSRQYPDNVLIAPHLGERSHVLAVALEESGFTGMPASEVTSQLVYPRRPVVLLFLARRGFSPSCQHARPAPNGPRQSSNALRLQLLPSDTCGLATAWEQFQHSPKSVERPRKRQTAGAPAAHAGSPDPVRGGYFNELGVTASIWLACSTRNSLSGASFSRSLRAMSTSALTNSPRRGVRRCPRYPDRTVDGANR